MKDKNILIVNEKDFLKKKKGIVDGGARNLHVLSDFDQTLTQGIVKGEKSASVIAQIRNGNYLNPDYVNKAHDLFDIYHPIEIDPNISMDVKIDKMHEWWEKHFGLLIESGLTYDVILDVAKNRPLKFRKKSIELLDTLYKNNIPFVIISASMGDIIKEYLLNIKKMYNNICLISNFLKFDKSGKMIEAIEPIIHTFNKNEIVIKDLQIHKELLKRKNVILLGDNLDDVLMIEGFSCDNLIKIGFLNENVSENLSEFKKDYDVIILNDIGMEFVYDLVEEIIKGEKLNFIKGNE
ncbi:hypothetical protein GOV12_07320 [Candidatus Pacearchaeota archaeon]|nr:hypothetical protein [Candidatus Pacearchaeota archaeon]